MNDLYVRGGVCSFRNQYINIHAKALKLSVLSFSLLKRITYNVQPKKRSLRARKPYTSYLIPAATAAMILFCVCLVHAGQRGLTNPAATGVALSTDSIKPLKIGDTIPGALWNLPLQMVKAGQEGSTTVMLKDYKGKLIIIDFWATWCTPCVAMIPKVDSLQQAFAPQVQFISVSYQPNKEVLPFLRRLAAKGGTHTGVPFISHENTLQKYFPHRELPHYVWLGADSRVKAFTGPDEITAANVQRATVENLFDMEQKVDVQVAYNREKPLFAQNGFGDSLYIQSNISGYIAGIGGGWSSTMKHQDAPYHRITIRNCGIAFLYSIAYGKNKELIGKNRWELNVKDTTVLTSRLVGTPYNNWLSKHGYCYELIVSDRFVDKAWDLVIQDLHQYFPQYNAQLVKRAKMCWVLKKTAGYKAQKAHSEKPSIAISRYKVSLKQGPISSLISRLNLYYQQLSPFPLVDGTGIKDPIDLELAADLTKMDEINKALAPLGLIFEKQPWEIDVLSISDRIH